MRNLAEDKLEITGEGAEQRFVARRRNEWGIGPDDPATWFVHVAADEPAEAYWLGASPGDALHVAATYAEQAGAQPRGVGRWLLEPGDEGRRPTWITVTCKYDPEGYPEAEAAA